MSGEYAMSASAVSFHVGQFAAFVDDPVVPVPPLDDEQAATPATHDKTAMHPERIHVFSLIGYLPCHKAPSHARQQGYA
jgi:hypothetical protein